MTGRLAVDFGTSNTVLAVWDHERQAAKVLTLPELSRYLPQGDAVVPVIPSLIHYAGEDRRWLGEQVHARGLYGSARTFRWMKRYLLNRSPLQVRVDQRSITPLNAAQDFLQGVLLFAAAETGFGDEEIALTTPVEAFEHYENWLGGVVESAGFERFRLIDEPSAAALGYGASIQPGDVYLIFDFGGGTLDVSVVLIEAEPDARAGRRCRVLGKSGADLGGATLDAWLFEEVLRQNGLSADDELVRPLSVALLASCEILKEQLSQDETAELHLADPSGSIEIHASLDRYRFEALLDRHAAFTSLDRAIRRALNAANERGYADEAIKAVLMVGGSSQIPSIQQTVRRIFGSERVMLHRPLDAVACGAAAFIAGVDFYDHIQHDYAIRHVNPLTGAYEYRTLVVRGTAYPSQAPVARLAVKASYPGQTRLGLAIYELNRQAATPISAGTIELIFDPSGAARITQLAPADIEKRSQFWLNEHNLTFLVADPPAEPGQARFSVEFNLDRNKRLLVTARDLYSGGLIIENFPVVKLT